MYRSPAVSYLENPEKLLPIVLAMTFAVMAKAQEPQIPPGELVRSTATHELRAADAPGHCRYRLHEETARGSKTEEVIESRDWRIKRLMQINHKPLTREQRERENRRLTHLLTDPMALRNELKKQRKDEQRVREIVQALPEAFRYEYDGIERKDPPRELLRLRFGPNPAFVPPTRELRVLQGMEGSMSIDASVERLAAVQAKLVRRVSFAWGILAHLDRGGSFLLQQQEIDHGRWHATTVALHFTGRILFFKRLNIDSTVLNSDFRCGRDELTLVQGLELLTKEDDGALSPSHSTDFR
jgi:hypothetical protein